MGVTVQELISELEQYNPEATVKILTYQSENLPLADRDKDNYIDHDINILEIHDLFSVSAAGDMVAIEVRMIGTE
jgi:hypothetical protein